MGRVDLDTMQARYEQAADLGGNHPLAPHNYRDLKRSWEDVPALIAELRVAHAAYDALVKLHDDYSGPDPTVRGALYRILAAWDGMPPRHVQHLDDPGSGG